MFYEFWFLIIAVNSVHRLFDYIINWFLTYLQQVTTDKILLNII